jgi:hypothetical protein
LFRPNPLIDDIKKYRQIEIKPNILTTTLRTPQFYIKNGFIDMVSKKVEIDYLIKYSAQYMSNYKITDYNITENLKIKDIQFINELNNSFPKPEILTPQELNEKITFLSNAKPKQLFSKNEYSSLRPVTAAILNNDYNLDCEFKKTRIYLFYKSDDDYFFKELRDEESKITAKGGRQSRFKPHTKRKRNLRKRKTRKYKQSPGRI